jgi:sugar phosphate isomerase/epimerase
VKPSLIPASAAGVVETASRRYFLKSLTAGAATVGVGVATRLQAAESTSPAPGPSRMRLGLVTYELAKDWDLPTLLKNCQATGFEGVELRTTHAHKVEVDLPAEARKEVRRRFEDSGVTLVSLGSTFDYHTPDPVKLKRDIEATKEYILLARDVGAGGVKVRPNGLPREVPVEQTLAQIGRALREVGEFAAQHRLQIRLEVHGDGTSLLPNIQKIMDAADRSNVGVCWNSNQTDLVGDGFDANFDRVKSRIQTAHLRDLFLAEYPWRHLFARLNETGFAGFAMAEIPPSADPLRVMRYFRALWLALQDRS